MRHPFNKATSAGLEILMEMKTQVAVFGL